MERLSPSKHRIFIALPIEIDPNKLDPVNEKLEQFNPILKVVPTKNYHITLKFIGDVNGDTYNDIISNFKQIKIPLKKIEYTLNGLGSFPGFSRANVLWCGIRCNLKATDQLKTIIEDFTSQFGINRDERKFKPHLTLARIKKNKKIPGELVDFFKNKIETNFGSGYFDKIILYESELTPKGSIYTELNSLLLD